MTNILEQRREKIFGFLKTKIEWIQYLLLLVIIWIGWAIRAKPIKSLIDVTTGQHISIELDSTLYLRYAEYIAEHGKLFALDVLRFHPLGASVDITVFSSYFVAYLYRILNFFGYDGSVALVNNYYPLVATVILSIFLFLLVRRMFDWRVASLSLLLLNLAPPFLFRSMGGSSDHDILGLMFVVMAFYFYLIALQSKKIKFNILFGFIAGVISVLGLLTAGSMNFFFLSASSFIIIEIIFNRFTKNDLFTLTSFLFTFTVILLGMNRTSLSGLISSYTTGLFYLAFIIGLFYLYIYNDTKFNGLLNKYSFLKKIPAGAFSFLFCLIISIFILTLFFGTDFVFSRFNAFVEQLLKNFSLTRWVMTVAENKRPYVADWLGQFGKLLIYFFMFGSIALFYDAVKNSKRAKYLSLAFAIFLFSYIFSRYSGNSILNGESTTSHFIFFGSLILFGLSILTYYFYSYLKEKDEFEALTKFDKKHTLLLSWTLVMILVATSAIRFLFEFTLIVVLLSAYFMIYALDFFMSRQHNYIKYFAIILFILILFSPFTFAQGILVSYYQSSVSAATYSGPGYNQQWQIAGKWVRENTPNNAVFAHWWDYGYWVQSGFQRATVTDGGNFFGWWNYLMGRNVLTAQTNEEPLKFLKAHSVTHVLVVPDEIGKYPAYSSIGSDHNADRYSYIPTFNLNQDFVRKTRNSTILVYTGGFGLDTDINYNGRILPRNSAVIIGIEVPLRETEVAGQVQQVLLQPTAIIAYQNQRYDLKLKCIYLDKLYMYENFEVDGCFRIMPVLVDQNRALNYGAGLYLSKTVANGFVGRMYLLDQQSENFNLVYNDNASGIPLAIYQGRIIGPFKIWEVKYPNSLTLTQEEIEYFTTTSYPDSSLLKPL